MFRSVGGEYDPDFSSKKCAITVKGMNLSLVSDINATKTAES